MLLLDNLFLFSDSFKTGNKNLLSENNVTKGCPVVSWRALDGRNARPQKGGRRPRPAPGGSEMEAGAHTFLRICPHLFAAIPSQFPATWPLLPVLHDFFVEGMVPCQKTARPSLSSRSPQGVRAYFPELRYQNAGLSLCMPPPMRPPFLPEEEPQRHSPLLHKNKTVFIFLGRGLSIAWVNPHAPVLFPFFSLFFTALQH